MKSLQEIGLVIGFVIIYIGLTMIHAGLGVAFIGIMVSATAAAGIMLDAYKEELLRQKRSIEP